MKKNKNILLQLHRHEAKAGVRRTSVDHSLGTLAKWVYSLSFLWTMVMNLLYYLSVYVQRGHAMDLPIADTIRGEDYIAITSGSLTLVIIMSIVIIAGAVCRIKRLYIPCILANVIPALVLIFHFKSRMSDLFAVSDGIPSSYLFRHLLPLAIMAVAAILYGVIGILYNISENKAYEKFVAKIYEQHPDRFGKMTDEEWGEFLNSYEPPSKKDLKKSRKTRHKTENTEE